MNYVNELKSIKKIKGKADIRYLRYILHGLQWTSEEYSSALYISGKNIGKKIIGPEISATGIKSVCNEIIKLFKDLGIGKLSIKELGEKRIVFEMKSGACSSKMVNVNDRVCFFESGLIAGILESKLKKSVKVHETMCGGLGDPVDEFEVKL